MRLKLDANVEVIIRFTKKRADDALHGILNT